MPPAKRGRIRLYFEGESRSAEAAAKRTEAAVDGVGAATDRYNKSAVEQSAAVESVNRRNFELVRSTGAVNKETDTLTKRLQDVNVRFTSMKNIVGLLKLPALATGAGLAAQGLGVAGVGATSLVSALAPLSGALAAYPALLGGVGQAAGVLALTQMDDLKEALGGNEEALKKLTPEAREFLGVLKDFETPFERMRSSVQGELFPGLSRGMRDAGKNLPVVDRLMNRTAGTMGRLAERAGALLGSKGFGRDFERVGEGNARMLGRMGVAGIKLTSSLRHVMVAAQPFLGWLSGSAIKFADWVDGAAKAGRESGRLEAFLGRTRDVMERLFSITQSLSSGFLQIGHAAAPLGRQILASFDSTAQRFEDWTESMKGRNTLRDYFAQAKPTVFELGRLIGDAGGAFLRLSNDKGIFKVVRALRVDLLPVLEEVIGTTTNELGTRFINLFVQLGQVFGTFAGSSGPLVMFLDSLTRMVTVVNDLLDTVPGLKELAVTLVGFGAVSRAMKFTAAATGLTSLIGLFGKLRTAATGAAVAESAAMAAGAGGVGAPGGVGGRAGRFLGRAQAGIGIGLGGTLLGSQIGGRGGSVASMTAQGAGLGMMLGPAGALAGGAAGAIIGAATSTGEGIGNELAASMGSSFEEKFGPALTSALNRKNVGRLEGLQKKLRFALNVAIAGGADDASLKPIRDKLAAIGNQMASIEVPRNAVADRVGDLRSGLITRLKDINSLFRQNAASIEQGWRHGSEGWRNATVSSMRGVVAAIRTGMNEGTIAAETGKQRIAALLHNVKLVQGDDPLGIAKGFANSWARAGQINAQGIQRILTDMRRMPKGARETAQDAMIRMAQGLESKGELVKGSASRLQSALLTKFGKTNDRLVRDFGGAVKGIAGLFDGLGGAVATALESLGINVNSALRAFGVSKAVKFGVKVGSSALDALGNVAGDVVDVFKAEGGWVAAPSRRDSVLAALGRDEAVVNVHQQPEVERGLLLAKMLGLGRHGSLNELFAGVQRPNYLAKGGFSDRIPRPQITGPDPLRSAGQNGVNRAYQGALRYVRKHSRAVGSGSLVQVGRQLQRLGYEVGEHPAFGGVTGVHVGGSDHYSGHAFDVNDDAAPFGHGNSEMESLDWLASQLRRIPHRQIIWRNHDLDTGAAIGGHMDHLHFAAALGGFARRAVRFDSGGRVPWDKLVGSSWDTDEMATLAHVVGASSPGLMGAIGWAESRGDEDAENHNTNGTVDEGLWQINSVHGYSNMKDPLANANAMKAILGSQGLSAWVTYNEGLVGAKGRVDAGLAAQIRAAMAGKAIGGDGAGTKKRDDEFGLAKKNFAVSMPGLRPTKLPAAAQAAAKALPAGVQALLRQPGLTPGQQIQVGETALSEAEGTAGFDDDEAAALFIKPFLQKKENRLRKTMTAVNKELRKGGENENQRKRKLERRDRLREALSETRGGIRGLDEKLEEGRPKPRDFADLDLARAESTVDRGDDIGALQKLVAISEKELRDAEKSGDPREIAEATRNLKSAADALRDATPTASDFANRDLALAELTETTEDDKAALEKLKSLAQQQLDAALATADPRDDIEAAQNLKSVADALKLLEGTINEVQQQREEFEKERLDLDKKLVTLAEAQGPAFLAAFAAWIDGAIGGPVAGRTRLATAGVSAGYQ